jgi:hypothetical protein
VRAGEIGRGCRGRDRKLVRREVARFEQPLAQARGFAVGEAMARRERKEEGGGVVQRHTASLREARAARETTLC